MEPPAQPVPSVIEVDHDDPRAAELFAEYLDELKRMFVRTTGRGLGVGRLLLEAAEAAAAEIGYSVIRLDTRSELTEAAGLYGRSGSVPIERYNHNPTANSFWEKRLAR